MKRLGAVVAVVGALGAAPVRRKLVEWFTRVNGTWVGVPPVPTHGSVDARPERAPHGKSAEAAGVEGATE